MPADNETPESIALALLPPYYGRPIDTPAGYRWAGEALPVPVMENVLIRKSTCCGFYPAWNDEDVECCGSCMTPASEQPQP